MTHLFKHVMEHSDMFIRSINLKAQLIEYQVFDKLGKPMEPIKKDKYITHNDEVIFDKNRSLPVGYIEHIAKILNS